MDTNRKRTGRAGGDKRGNSKDRAARRAFLLRHHGNGATAPCCWCGTDLDNDNIEADRLDEGGSYKRTNIVPACRTCNLARSDTPTAVFTNVATRSSALINATINKARTTQRGD